MNSRKPVIQIDNLKKTYGDLVAVHDVSLQVMEGEIFGIVGPNGAGKTTSVECIEGLRRPDKGEIRVLGLDVRRDSRALRERIGVQLQESSLQNRIKVWEAMDLFASFYAKPAAWEPLIEQLGLADKKDTAFIKLSGGQKQRLFIALSLVHDPEIVFLDELTTGLDPQARRTIWDLIRQVRDRGKTIVLTTHFMEEAERLCDRVAIMDRGRIVALDTPENLIRSLGAENRIVFIVENGIDLDLLRAVRGVTRVEQSGDRVIVYGRDDRLVVDVVNTLSSSRLRFRDLRTEQPTLEDVFLTLTGHELKD